MTANTRLAVCAVVIILSAVYALILEQDQGLAEAVALGYIAVVLTLMFILNVWKRSE
jgi:hypothetical protein